MSPTTIIDLQEAANACGEDDPLDCPGTAYQEVKRQADQIAKLRLALTKAKAIMHYGEQEDCELCKIINEALYPKLEESSS